MNRREYERKKEKQIAYQKEKQRAGIKRKKQFFLFLRVFLCVLLCGGALLTAIYAIKMHGVQAGMSQLTSDSEKILVEAFPFGVPGGNEVQAEKTEDIGKYADVLADAVKMQEENIYAKESKNPDEVIMTFAGDIMFDDSYSIMNTYKYNGGNINECISPTLIDEMQAADIFMINNECTFTTRGTPTAGKTYTFRGKPEYVKILQDIGADIVSLANNHAYDYGEISLLDTMDTLKSASVPYVGAGNNAQEASRPVYFIVNDIKIAILSATQIERVDNPDTKGATENSPGVFRCREPEALCAAIKEAKQNSDFVVVYVHWGTENETAIDWAQKEQAPLYAEAGADLIIGDHPHILQGIDYQGNTPVIYSLGNFWFNSKTIDTGMVKVTLDENGIKSYQFIPCLQSDCKTTLLSGSEKERVLQNMRTMSTGVNIDAEGYVTRQ